MTSRPKKRAVRNAPAPSGEQPRAAEIVGFGFDRIETYQYSPDRDRKQWVRLKREVAQLVDTLVAERIREGRVATGMTQQALADQIGIAAQQVHRYERGDSRITVGRLYQIAEVLGVSVTDFLSPQRGTANRGTGGRSEETLS